MNPTQRLQERIIPRRSIHDQWLHGSVAGHGKRERKKKERRKKEGKKEGKEERREERREEGREERK